MKSNTRWVIVDTETDGLFAPIHVVEIAAQAMCGWEPVDAPFQVYLDHNVRIPAAATAIHGYTREFLAEHGTAPIAAHEAFREYIRNSPMVCHNLSYDWNRALLPEWRRLGIAPMGRRGFCTMLLSRRIIPESPRHSLDALRRHFAMNDSESHHAAGDVANVVELFTGVLAPRLRALGIGTINDTRSFSRRKIATCHRSLREAMGGNCPGSRLSQ